MAGSAARTRWFVLGCCGLVGALLCAGAIAAYGAGSPDTVHVGIQPSNPAPNQRYTIILSGTFSGVSRPKVSFWLFYGCRSTATAEHKYAGVPQGSFVLKQTPFSKSAKGSTTGTSEGTVCAYLTNHNGTQTLAHAFKHYYVGKAPPS